MSSRVPTHHRFGWRAVTGFRRIPTCHRTRTPSEVHHEIGIGRAVEVLDGPICEEVQRLEDVAAKAGARPTRHRCRVPHVRLRATGRVCQRQHALDLTLTRSARDDLPRPRSLDVVGPVEQADGAVAVGAGVAGRDVVRAVAHEEVGGFGLLVDEIGHVGGHGVADARRVGVVVGQLADVEGLEDRGPDAAGARVGEVEGGEDEVGLVAEALDGEVGRLQAVELRVDRRRGVQEGERAGGRARGGDLVAPPRARPPALSPS